MTMMLGPGLLEFPSSGITVSNSTNIGKITFGISNFSSPSDFGWVYMYVESDIADYVILYDQWLPGSYGPSWYIAECPTSGDAWDSAVGSFDPGTTCGSVIDARGIESRGIGVSGTFSTSQRIIVKDSSSPTKDFCPGTSTVFDKTYAIEVTFTG